MTASLTAQSDLTRLCVSQATCQTLSQPQLDRIALQALQAGMRPQAICALLDQFARWHSLGYSGFDNPTVDAGIRQLTQSPVARQCTNPEALRSK